MNGQTAQLVKAVATEDKNSIVCCSSGRRQKESRDRTGSDCSRRTFLHLLCVKKYVLIDKNPKGLEILQF